MWSAPCLFLALWVALPSFAGDEPFAELAFEAALARAKAEQKLLLLDFTAEWCQPCKKMEKDTWAAADVKAWLKENAVAIQVDVDEEEELAQRFRVEAMPTVVVLRDGEEFDRAVGYKDAERFLAWARDVRAGKRSSDELRKRAEELRDGTDVRARYDLARDLARAGMHAEALHHYVWLWPATRTEVGFGGVRVSFMLSDMAGLARKHPPAKEAFEEIFAELQARIDGAEIPAFEDWQEWTAFCGYFGGTDRILAWYERHRDEDGRLFDGAEGFLPQLIASEVFDVLLDAKRPLDATRLLPDARKKAEELVLHYERVRPSDGIAEEHRAELEKYVRSKLVDDLGRLHAALLLAGRSAEAADVAAKLLATLDTAEARLGLVRHALALVEQPVPELGRWLDEAEAAGGDARSLRRKLERLERRRDDGDGVEDEGD